VLALTILLATMPQVVQLKPYSTLKNKNISEMSGMVKSRRFPDTYWLHNDSGDSARLFAVHLNGGDISTSSGIRIDGAENQDWEDIAIDGRTIYISDLGNNNSRRRNLAIYSVTEPDPSLVSSMKVLAKYPVAYPDQNEFPPSGKKQFDCEAIFRLRGKLFLITKHRFNAILPDVSAKLYRMDTMSTAQVNRPVKVDTAENLDGWVTGADVSPNGKTLAVLTNLPAMSIWLFATSAPGDKFFTGGSKRQILLQNAKQCEAITWLDDKTLIVGNEQGELFKVDAS
jgi:hypothetical protein